MGTVEGKKESLIKEGMTGATGKAKNSRTGV